MSLGWALYTFGSPRCCSSVTRLCLSTALHHLHPNRRILLKANPRFRAPMGRKIRLFCGWGKWLVLSSEQPLCPAHGRQRYNTLDFAHKVVCHETPASLDSSRQEGHCPPMDTTRQGSAAAFGNHCQGNAVPFGFPCQQGAARPFWITHGQRDGYPFGNPADKTRHLQKGKCV